MKKVESKILSFLWISSTSAFSSSTRRIPRSVTLQRAAGEGSESSWIKALDEASGSLPGDFEAEMKMKGLLKKGGPENPKLSANAQLVQWLEENGEVYMSEMSAWGEAPHPMAISTETRDEITNESSGRGLLARRDVSDGDELLKIPLTLCLTKKSARKALGKDALPSEINEYLAIACQLIHEKYVKGETSEFNAYMGVLPEISEVNPTFTWSDDDLKYLEGSPVIAATRSLQMKLSREYDALLGGENGLIAKFPSRFPAEVRTHPNMGHQCHFVPMDAHPRGNHRNSPEKTGSGHLPCYFLEPFASETFAKEKPWQWFHTRISLIILPFPKLTLMPVKVETGYSRLEMRK